jgi:predicted anti-sigma-YlaC factor YlaD
MAEDLTCQEVVELVTEYLEGAMPTADVARFEEHLDLCDGCDHYVDQIRTTIASLGRASDDNLPPETRERLLGAFREWKRS